MIRSGIIIMSLMMFVTMIGLAMSEHKSLCGDNCGNGPGEALIQERCTVCHNTDRIFAAQKDEAGWTATVDRMKGHGAKLNDDERMLVIATLTQGLCDACKDAMNN